MNAAACYVEPSLDSLVVNVRAQRVAAALSPAALAQRRGITPSYCKAVAQGLAYFLKEARFPAAPVSTRGALSR